MKINYSYSMPKSDEPYACIEVDTEVLNRLKSMVEDLIVNYARVQNFDGIDEAITVREELVRAINALTPEPIPEPEQEKAIPVKWLLSLSDNPMFTDNFRNNVDEIAKLWREEQEKEHE